MFVFKEATEIHGLLLVLQDCDSDAAATADESTNGAATADEPALASRASCPKPKPHKEPAPVVPNEPAPKEPAPVRATASKEPAPVEPRVKPLAAGACGAPAPVEPPVEDWWLRWCSQCGENAYWREGAFLNPACKVTRQIGLKMKEV